MFDHHYLFVLFLYVFPSVKLDFRQLTFRDQSFVAFQTIDINYYQMFDSIVDFRGLDNKMSNADIQRPISETGKLYFQNCA